MKYVYYIKSDDKSIFEWVSTNNFIKKYEFVKCNSACHVLRLSRQDAVIFKLRWSGSSSVSDMMFFCLETELVDTLSKQIMAEIDKDIMNALMGIT